MKIRTKFRKKISIENSIFTLALFCISTYALLEHTSITIPMFSYVKYPLLLVAGLCLFTQLNLFFKSALKKKYFYILLVLLLLSIMLLLTSYANRNASVGTNPLYSTSRLIVFIIELFGLMIWAAETERKERVFDFLFKYVLLLIIITDVLFFTRLLVFYQGRHEIFIIGNKFSVSYMHMNLLTLWFVRSNIHRKRESYSKLFVFFTAAFILAVAIRVDCMTGVIGCVALFVIFMLLNTKIQRQFMRLTHPGLLSFFFVGSVAFPSLSGWLLSLPAVRYVVQELMGRSVTLTGRLSAYEVFFEKVYRHLLWGYGYGNGNEAAVKLFGLANSQNALLEWVLEVGIPTTLVLCALMLMIFAQLNKSREQRALMPLVALIYVYTILGMVETTFDMNFIMWFALVFMAVNEKKPIQAAKYPAES